MDGKTGRRMDGWIDLEKEESSNENRLSGLLVCFGVFMRVY